MVSTPSVAEFTLSPPRWIRPYLGIPYRILDCWQLVVHVTAIERGVVLEDFAGEYEQTEDESVWAKGNRARVAAVVEREMPRWQRVERPEPFDVALYRVHGGWHTALVIGGGWVLNTNRDRGSHPMKLTDPDWAERCDGYYRHCPSR